MKRFSLSAPTPYINFTMTFGKNFWMEASHAGKKAADSLKKSLPTAMSATWTVNTVRTIFQLCWNSGSCLFPLHFAEVQLNCTARNACGMISGSISRTMTIFKNSLTRRKKHCCVPPICRSGSPTSWNTAAPTVRLTGRRYPRWHALC
jgi:methylthioribose-1-phosphate isomerase